MIPHEASLVEGADVRAQRRAAERALILQAQKGSLEAFEELVRTYERKVYFIARSMIGDPVSARDLTQDTFLRVWQGLARFKLEYNFYTWLYRIVVNLCIDYLRKHGRFKSHELEACEDQLMDGTDPHLVAEQHEVADQVNAVLDQLPVKYRLILVLRDMQGLDCDEVARVIQCTPATTRWRLHRARMLFRELWERAGVGANAGVR
jgi:RNA polymerase sigma-70 factor (ECF subfamily)